MSDDPRRLTTEAERERLYAARRRGGSCALCGRELREGEPVYWEQFLVGMRGRFTNQAQAPVGVECASPRLLEEMAGQPAEPCARCGRPVYQPTARTTQRWSACSGRCRTSISQREGKRRAKIPEDA
jgi:hypothetical protein